MRTQIRAFILIGGISVLVFGTQGIVLLLQSGEHWWTHADMPLTLEAARDRVEIHVAGRLMQKQLADGGLLLRAEGGAEPLRKEDVGIRLNNRHRIRAERLPWAFLTAALFGVGAALLGVGLGLWVRARREGLRTVKEA
jgi:hypothetical protein